MNRRSLLVAARALAIIVLVAAAVPILLELLGFAPAPALRALLVGSIGSFDALVSATLVRVTPLMLTGLAVAVAFRAGVFNIGAEGQLLTGAACAAAVGLAGRGSLPGAIALPFELIAGAIGGASWAAIAAVLRARFRVLEVISTILLNFIALYLVSYLVRGPLQEPLHIYPQSEALPADARLPRVIAGSRLHAGFPLAIATAMILWWYVRFTAGGAGFSSRLSHLCAGRSSTRAVDGSVAVPWGTITCEKADSEPIADDSALSAGNTEFRSDFAPFPQSASQLFRVSAFPLSRPSLERQSG